MIDSLRGYWSEARPAQRFADLVGATLIVTGLVHGAIWLVVGGSADGPLPWRKPTMFGVSFGLLIITMAWLAQFLSLSERALRITLGTLATVCVIEVTWVSVQHARGVLSHFNDSTPLDEGIFIGAGVAIAVGLGVIVNYTVRAFTSSTATPSMTLAIRAALLMLLVSMAVGGWMIVRGAVPHVPDPAVVPAGGDLKLAHAVGVHGLQTLCGLAWLLSFGRLTERRRRALVAVAALGYAALTGSAVVPAAVHPD